MQVTELGLTHVVAPPESWLIDMYLLGGCETNPLASSQRHRKTERLSVGSTFDNTFHRLIREVPQFCGHREPCLIERFCVHPRTDGRMRYDHVAAGLHLHFAVDAHVLVCRPWVPVGKSDVRLSGLGTEHLDGQHILWGYLLGDVKLKLSERTGHLLTVGDLLTIKPNVGTIADTVEVEYGMFSFLQGWQFEGSAIPPALLKALFVDLGIVLGCECLGFDAVGRQHTHQR